MMIAALESYYNERESRSNRRVSDTDRRMAVKADWYDVSNDMTRRRCAALNSR